jgi:hypothetical protein
MLRRMIVLTGTAVLAAILSLSANASPIYNFTSFDGPGNNGGGTTVNGINNFGDVVGFSSDNAATPTLFTNFIRNANGTFNLLNIGGDPLAMANGINDLRTVVGGTSNFTAFTLSGGTLTTLPAVNGTTTSQTAFGINNAGTIVGQYTDSTTGTTPGYRLSGGSYTTLTPLPTAAVTNAQGVNNSGLVTGFYSLDGVHQHGFFYNSATNSFSLVADPNIPNLVLTQFLGLNDNGLAVGYYQLPDGSQHGFLYDITTGQYSFLDDPFAAKTGVSITQITGINDSGEITGFYDDATTGLQRGFVATVPEPSTWSMLLLGFAGIALMGYRKSKPALLAACGHRV